MYYKRNTLYNKELLDNVKLFLNYLLIFYPSNNMKEQ